MTYSDVIIHGNYVGPIIEYCPDTPAKNMTQFCDTWRDILNIQPSDHQLKYGSLYWISQQVVVYSIATIMFTIRIFVPLFFLNKWQWKQYSTLAFAGIWFLTSVSFFFFGFLDFQYYLIKDHHLPAWDHAWGGLEKVGSFQTFQWANGIADVQTFDVLVLMLTGVIFIVSLWIFAIYYLQKLLEKSLKLYNKISDNEKRNYYTNNSFFGKHYVKKYDN